MREPIVSPRIYVAVFAALVVLTLVTTGAAFIDLGVLNPVVALSIAVAKASLVVLYFMQVRYSPRLTWVFIGMGILWLTILMALTLSDVLTRGWLPIPVLWTSEAAPPASLR
jgi:cytochrome c oxidase subunit 4